MATKIKKKSKPKQPPKKAAARKKSAPKKHAVRMKKPAVKKAAAPQKEKPMSEKRGRGRPRQPESERHKLRSDNLQIKCSPAEHEGLQKLAAKAGFKVFSNWVRERLGLDYEEPSDEPKEKKAPRKPRAKKAAPVAASSLPKTVPNGAAKEVPAAAEEAPI